MNLHPEKRRLLGGEGKREEREGQGRTTVWLVYCVVVGMGVCSLCVILVDSVDIKSPPPPLHTQHSVSFN